MKNYFIMIVLFIALFSCKKDKELQSEKFSINGIWIEYASDRMNNSNGTASFSDEHFTFLFLKDNTGLLTVEGKLYPISEKRNFTYDLDIDNKSLKLIFLDKPNSPWISAYSLINDNTIVWYNITLHRN